MAIAARNDPCPCGSGRKYKKCCGFDRSSERRIEDSLSAAEEIAALAFDSPRLIPLSDAFEDWVRAVVAGEKRANIEEAIARVGEDESRRIAVAFLKLHAREWPDLVARSGSEKDALTAMLGGAVAAGIRDFRPPEHFALEIVEESDDLLADPFGALGMCLDGGQLWDPDDGREAERAIATIPDWIDDDAYDCRWHEVLAEMTARSVTDWHRRRLGRLVARIGQQLPYDGFLRASAAVRSGCEQFGVDESFRLRLAATLLGDMVGRDQIKRVRAALFAA